MSSEEVEKKKKSRCKRARGINPGRRYPAGDHFSHIRLMGRL